MPTFTITMSHEGETLEQCIAELESNYAVTVTVVEPYSGDGGWPLVRLDAPDPRSIQRLLVGAYGYDKDEAAHLVADANPDD
jgi:hypothetical protein